MINIENKIIDTIKRYDMLYPGAHVAAAFSGGADSTALVNFLYENAENLNIRLSAIHVNHMIRGEEADRDEVFARSFCEKRNIPLEVYKKNIPEMAKAASAGLEECARNARYNIFKEFFSGALVATAHNQNDSAETFFLNLFRGSGLKGLTGIPPVRGNIIRPLIFCERKEILEYCREKKLDFVNDSTNFDNSYRRNAIRNIIMPEIEKINGSFYSSLYRCQEALKADEEYLNAEAHIISDKLFINDKYNINILLNMHISIRRRIISIIGGNLTGAVLEFKHIEKIDEIMESGGSVTVSGGHIICSDGKFLFLKGSPLEKPKISHIIEDFSNSIEIGSKKVDFTVKNEEIGNNLRNISKEAFSNTIDCDKLYGRVILRNRLPGDKFARYGHKCTKPLKKLFSEKKIPPEEREGLLMLADCNGVFWVEGFGIDERVKIDNNTKKFVFLEVRNYGNT
ncbi:MAG: tRNA lysidine(34) synthetase TilS [Oscillospiraceae bacterium]|nr:tRNA lysidine(34) synthetase TilS [Oscillospiraceae bacterium]